MLGLAIPPMPKKPPPPKALIALNLRVPPDLLEAVDQWVTDVNATRSWPKLTRSDLIRLVLERLVKERPDWVGK